MKRKIRKTRKPKQLSLFKPDIETRTMNGLAKASGLDQLSNGLGDAIGYPGGNQVTGWMGNMPFPGQGGYPGGFSVQQVSDSTTAFENLRWYYVSNFRQLMSELYVEVGLVKTIVDVPVDDAFKGGVLLLSKQLSEDQIRQLQISLERDDDLSSVKWAAKWDRLFGGAGVLILTDDQDPVEPFDIKAIGPNTALEFRDADMWELFWDKQNTEGYDPQIQSQDFQHYEYYSELVHKSRVMRIKGNKAPSFTRPFFRGWGVSVVEQLIRSINQFFKAVDVGFDIVDELKLDVYRMKNLTNTLLTPGGSNDVQARIQMANWQKNYQNALVLDSEDEFEYKQISFAGLADYMEQARMQIAADLRMPIIKVFGTAVSHGFQTSQEEMENYNSMVESEIRNKIKYDVLRVCEIKCQKLFGFVPDDLEVEFKPLRELTATDQETVRTAKFQRATEAMDKGIIRPEKFVEIANQSQFFDVKLEPDDIVTGDLEMPDEADSSENQDGDLDIDDPGANRADTRIVKADADVPPTTPMMAPKVGERVIKNPKEEDSHRLSPVKKLKRNSLTEEMSDGDEKIRDAIDMAVWEKAKAKCLKKKNAIDWVLVNKFYKELKGA